MNLESPASWSGFFVPLTFTQLDQQRLEEFPCAAQLGRGRDHVNQLPSDEHVLRLDMLLAELPNVDDVALKHQNLKSVNFWSGDHTSCSI